MGAFLDTVSVRTGDVAAVRALIVNWMRAKSYELRPEAPLLPVNEWGLTADGNFGGGDERGVFLLSNGRWTVALYSHMIAEGDRLLFELGRTPDPVLRTWVHDSDLWGYKLHKDGDLLAEFNSDPRYFDEEAAAEPVSGDPTLVCAVCGLGGLETELATLQRGRALFMEGISRRFCALIGAAPAGFGYRDLAECGLDTPGPRTLGGFQVEHLYFRRGGPAAEPLPDLHMLPIRPRDSDESDTQQHEFSAADQFGFRMLSLVLRLIFLLLYPLLFLIRWALWFRFRVLRRSLFGPGAAEMDPFTRELFAAHRTTERLEGRTLISERHRCTITLPEGVEPHPMQSAGRVFHFSVNGRPGFCEAVPPERIGDRLRPPVGYLLVEDENFFVGALRARRIVWRTAHTAWPFTYDLYVVQGPRVYYLFGVGDKEPLTAEEAARYRALVESFTLPAE